MQPLDKFRIKSNPCFISANNLQVLQLNISSQQSTIDSLNEKAITLKRTSRDGNLGAQIAHVVDRYEKLVKRAKVRL